MAALLAHGRAVPRVWPGLAGVGIGLVSGAGSVCYCLALGRVPAWLAASVANAYVLVTVLLGVLILGESLTWLALAGLGLTLAGVVALSPRSGGAGGGRRRPPLAAAWPLGAYVGLVGVGTFLEKPALRRLTALQLNALTALGMAALGLAVVGARDRCLPPASAALAGSGVGALLGLGAVFYYLGLAHLPVSVAAPLGNISVLVTAALAVLVRHEAVTPQQIVSAVATLAGVTLLAVHHPLTASTSRRRPSRWRHGPRCRVSARPSRRGHGAAGEARAGAGVGAPGIVGRADAPRRAGVVNKEAIADLTLYPVQAARSRPICRSSCSMSRRPAPVHAGQGMWR